MIGPRVRAVVGALVGISCGAGADEIGSGATFENNIVAVVGQSNALGQQWSSNITNSLRTGIGNAQADILETHKWAQNRSSPAVWTSEQTTAAPMAAYTSSVNNNSGQSTNLIGFQQTLAYHLNFFGYEHRQTGFAMSGTNLETDWLGTYQDPDPNLLEQSITYLQEQEIVHNGRIKVIAWAQGESDAQVEAYANAYEDNLTTVFEAYHEAFPNAIIVFYKLHTGCNATYTSTVRTAQVAVAAALSDYVHMIDVDYMVEAFYLPDGYHFSADAYVALGHLYGNAIMDALGISAAIHPWTIDRVSLVADPQDATEWDALLAAASISSGGPYAAYDFAMASGNATSKVGAFTMTASGTNITYQAVNIAWERRFVQFAISATGQFTNTDAGQPDPASEAVMGLTTVYVSAPSTARNLYLWGTSAPTLGALAVNTGTTGWQVTSGANTVAGSADPTSQVRPWIQIESPSSPDDSRAYTDQEEIIGTPGTVSGKRKTIGHSGLNGLNAYRNHALFRDAAAKMTKTNVRNLLTAMNWYQPVGTLTSCPY